LLACGVCGLCYFIGVQYFGFSDVRTLIVSAGLVILLTIVTLPFFSKWFKKATDHWFYKGSYKHNEISRDFLRVLLSAHSSEEVKQATEKVLIQAVRPTFIKWEEDREADQKLDGYVYDVSDKTFLIIGPRTSGFPYTKKDLYFIQTSINQCAIAFERVLFSKKLEQQTRDLENIVQERTQENFGITEITRAFYDGYCS
jgi:hypothetical protein